MLSKLRPRSVYDVVAALALFVALGGTAWAVAANSVGTAQLKNGAVKNPKIAPGAVNGAKVADKSIGRSDLTNPVVSTLGDRCPSGMNQWGDSLCADKVVRGIMSWDNAAKTCAQAKMRLPSVSEAYLMGYAGGLSNNAAYWTDVTYVDDRYGATPRYTAVQVYGFTPGAATQFTESSNASYVFCVTNPSPG